MWLWVVVIVAVLGVIVVIAVGRDDSMAEAYDDRPDTTIATGRPLTADDLSDVRFSTGMRGYRMDEVDAFVARVQADLLAREHHAAPADEEAPRGKHVDEDAAPERADEEPL